MTEIFETNMNTEEEEVIKDFKWELDALNLEIKKECFKAEEKLKDEVKRLWFYNWDENWENIKFNIKKVQEYLEKIKDKSRSELEVKSSELEKWVWTIAIQIAINYINKKNWGSTNNIDWIDGIRGNKTWKWVKEFQTKYSLKNKDGLPGHETITKILEILKNSNTGSSTWWTKEKKWNTEHNTWDAENHTWNIENQRWNWDTKYKREEIIKNRLNNNIDNKRCTWLLKRSKLYEKDYDLSNLEVIDNNFINKLKLKVEKKWELEWIIFNNPEIQNLLNYILNHQWQEIQIMKQRYNQKKTAENKGNAQNEKSDNNNEEIVQSWDEYKYENFSQESFEEFILSDEWIAIITDEIKSHIDTSHENENGEYDRFYENYPLSIKNLEIKLKNAWESKIQWEYYTKNGIYDEEKKEEIEKLDVISNQITWYVDKIVWEHMKYGNGNFNQNIIQSLEWLLSEWYNGIPFDELFSDQNHKDTFKVILADKIKKYSKSILDKDYNNLDTWDKQINLQLKSYLYIYWGIFYSKNFKPNKDTSYYEEILPDIMKCIISDDDASLANKINHKEFLAAEKKLEEERKKRDLQRRKDVAKRNRENGKNYHSDERWKRIYDSNYSNGDINWATWAQIIRHSDINLSDFKVNNWNTEAFTNSWFAKQKAFWIAWENFTKSHEEIEGIITPEDMRNLYNTETNNIDEDARKEFLKSETMQWASQEEIDKIHKILKSFPNEFSNALKIIVSWAERQWKKIDEITRNHALWSVIDNVRFIFADIVEKWKWDSKFEWFKFEWSEPVKREWNDIIINGTFNWTGIKIRYDLISWWLFMNSFLEYSTPSKIRIWNNSDANLQIWQLESFDKILDEHYRAPDISLNNNSHTQNWWNQTHSNQNSWANQWWDTWENSEIKNSTKNQHYRNHIGNDTWEEDTHTESTPSIPTNTPSQSQTFKPSDFETWNKGKDEIDNIRKKYRDMLYANLNMINNNIIDNAKKQSTKNSIITKFMKTFNIMTDGQEDKSIDFNDWSNLFDFLQIIDNSDPNVLENFQLFMEKICDYSWLTRWNNNLFGSQKNSKYNITFNKNNNNEYISMIRDNAKSFSKDPKKFKDGVQNFDSNHQLWFAQMIIENITNNVSKPNWKLDQFKMDNFIRHLEIDGKES